VLKKSRKINFAFILVLLAFVLSPNPTALAWKEHMHKGQLTPMALDLVKVLHSKPYPREIWETFRGFIEQGAWDEDFPCNLSGVRANNHYRHALSGRGLGDSPWFGLGDPDVDTLTWAIKNLSLNRAEEFNEGNDWAFKGWGWSVIDVDLGDMSWTRAIERYGYTEDSKRLAYYTLGFLCHLLQDMGCPEHVHDDPHGASGYTGFELWVWQNWDTLKPILSGLKPRRFDTFEGFFRNLSLLGYSIDRFRGGELNKDLGTIDKNSDLGKMFKVRYNMAKAEWVLENYSGPPILQFSTPTGGSNIFNLDFEWNWSDYQKNPLWTKGHDEGEWWPTSVEIPDSSLNDEEGYYYIELSGDLPGEPFNINTVADPARNLYPATFLPSPILEVADQCTTWRVEDAGGLHLYSLIGSRIFPSIVEHTAGLIEHFFDIVNHPPFVRSVQVYQAGGYRYSVFWKDRKEPASSSISITDVGERSLASEFENLPKERDEDSCLSPGKGAIRIAFSEPVQDVAVKVGGRTLSGSLDKDESVWTGDFIIEEAGPSEETRAIAIYAKDKNDHYRNEGGSLDGNPATPAKRIENGQDYGWINYESGEDTHYSIRIKREKKDEQKPAARQPDILGTEWAELEVGFHGTWKRQDNSNTWIASWVGGCDRSILKITFQGNTVTILRKDECEFSPAFTAIYHGIIQPDGKTVKGTQDCNWPGGRHLPQQWKQEWYATIVR